MILRHFRSILPVMFRRRETRAKSSSVPTHVLIRCGNIYCDKNFNLSHVPFSTKNNPENITVNYEEVKNAISSKNTYIIDVREPDEIKEHGKIPASINIPLNEVVNTLSSMTDKEFENKYKRLKPTEDSPIIFYCMIGKRSGMAQQNALNLGFKQVKNYIGSWTDWSSKTK